MQPTQLSPVRCFLCLKTRPTISFKNYPTSSRLEHLVCINSLTHSPSYQLQHTLLGLHFSSTYWCAHTKPLMRNMQACAAVQPSIKVTRISKLLELRELVKWDATIATPGKAKPLVVILPFLYATPKAVDAYCRLAIIAKIILLCDYSVITIFIINSILSN